MLPLPVALLEHTTRWGRHFDLLLGDPALEPRDTGAGGGGGARLWTLRLPCDSSCWGVARSLVAVEIAPHRRAYLRYQGPLTTGRGRVRRVDQGVAAALQWSRDRRVLRVTARHFTGELELRRLSRDRWRMKVLRPTHACR